MIFRRILTLNYKYNVDVKSSTHQGFDTFVDDNINMRKKNEFKKL